MTRARVVVLGGGFGGLEAAFYLRHKLGTRIDLALVSDRDHFLFTPDTIYVPFGEDPERLKVPLHRPTRRQHIELVQDRVLEVDPARKRVRLIAGELGYDYLVVATGADVRPSEIPGLAQHALTVWTPEEMLKLRAALGRLVEQGRAGGHARILFLIPPENGCPGPLYEMILMTDTWLRRQGVRGQVDMTWTTYERRFIQAFGPRLDTVVTDEFEERGIHGFRGFTVTGVEPGVVRYRGGATKAFDLLISFPPCVAKERYPHLPGDDRGFIRVEAESRRVKGHAGVFAVGDAADFPIKQAFLALLQADAAAEQIAAEVEGRAPALAFEPRSVYVIEALDRATFAQVPLKYTGDPLKPVTVATEDTDHYRIGVSPLWRLGKKVLGLYVPWRFGNGEPFHAGFAGETIELGLKVMGRLMAD
jgi:sulfide:quinone oxidoreductase